MRSHYAAFTALSLSLFVAGCSHFDDTGTVTADDGGTPSTDADGGAADSGPKGEVVTGTPDPNTITEEHGVFVAPSGNDSNDGSRVRPYATLAAAITRAAQVGKIVFACTGTYAEALVVTDSISVIGGLDCSGPEWKTGAAMSRLASPTSPAITAKSIMSPTRLEGLDVVAPSATDAGASSIGLFADHAPGIYVANSKITAGDGAPGADGTNPSPLVETGAVDGAASTVPVRVLIITTPPGAVGGRSTCGGGAGGIGGSGGLWQVQPSGSNYFWVAYGGSLTGGLPGGVGGGVSAVDGNSGGSAPDLGTLTSDGYVPSNGNAGGNGTAGAGGAGGVGGTVVDMGTAQSSYQASNWAGVSGPGGGAGGCAGLAGTPGAGGGGSFGAALVESPITFESVALTSGNGGAAGHGTLGADPTPGGAAGTNSVKGSAGASAGSRGGYAGISTNGSNGPSIGILFTPTAPLLKGTTKATPGSGAPAIDAVTDPASSRTIPATPAGVSIDMQKL